MYLPTGDDAAPASSTSPVTSSSAFNLHDIVTSEPVKTGAAIALTYHGYKRTGSLAWALVYGLAGRWFPAAAVPISIAQGFGERKPCP